MSPILVRPVREQLEHDRLVRFLLLKYKRRGEVIANTGDERTASIKIGPNVYFPDLLVTEGKKTTAVVEVETGESVNNLEALAQWVHFAKARVPFHLYVPVASYDGARRLCDLHQIHVTEFWTYRAAMDGFDLIAGTPTGRGSASARNGSRSGSRAGTNAAAASAPAKPNGAAAKPAAVKPVPAKPAAAKLASTKPAPAKSSARKPVATAKAPAKPPKVTKAAKKKTAKAGKKKK